MMMLKSVSVFMLSLMLSQVLWSQEIRGVHHVQEGNSFNEYFIKTKITGLVEVDLARIKYFISKEHTYQASNNKYFSKIEDNQIKIFILSIPTTGVVEIAFKIVLQKEGVFNFPVEFQYSKNDEKIRIDLDSLKIENTTILVAEELPLNDEIEAEREKEESQKIIAKELTIQKEEEVKVGKLVQEKREVKNKTEELLSNDKIEAKVERVKEMEKQRVIAEELVAQKEEEIRVEKLAQEKKEAEVTEAQKLKEKQEEVAVSQQTIEVKYGVQLFALSKYTQQKIIDFCKRNRLSYDKISTIKIKGLTRVRYGVVNTKEEAEKLRKELLSRPGIKGGFVVKLTL